MPNYANNIFAVQQMANNCATDILNAYADYENSRSSIKQIQADNDDYNELVDAYNVLLAKAKELAQYHHQEQNENASLQRTNTKLARDNHDLLNECSKKDDEIVSIKAQLEVQDRELQSFKVETERLSETVFTFTLVNTILSSKAAALKNVLTKWNDMHVFKKQSFINALKEENRKVDFEKNRIPTTNSVEASAYLESHNKPLFNKLQSISF